MTLKIKNLTMSKKKMRRMMKKKFEGRESRMPNLLLRLPRERKRRKPKRLVLEKRKRKDF